VTSQQIWFAQQENAAAFDESVIPLLNVNRYPALRVVRSLAYTLPEKL
jgi:hypothetical protein